MAVRNLKLITTCPNCGKKNEVLVNDKDFRRFENTKGRGCVRDYFPYLTESEREYLISGMCDDCWDELMQDPDGIGDLDSSLG